MVSSEIRKGAISIQQLSRLCIINNPIKERIFFTPGVYMDAAKENLRAPINGEFGLQLKSIITDEILAYSGFNIEQETMVIEHTPQGAYKRNISRVARQELLQSNFREEMMKTMIEVAKLLGLKRIKGISAENHFKVQGGFLNISEGRKKMNDVYEQVGFLQSEEDWNYYLEFS